MARLFCILSMLLLASASSSTVAAEPDLADLAKPGRILMLRHALAPGHGDPPGFRIGDCASQRNLDAAGRAQARALGGRMRAAGLRDARVYASQWCRCLDTARLLALGEVEELPALNSFFQQQEERRGRLSALAEFFAGLPVDGTPVILVTHQVTISAQTGIAPGSGGGVLLQANGTGAPRVLGAIAAP